MFRSFVVLIALFGLVACATDDPVAPMDGDAMVQNDDIATDTVIPDEVTADEQENEDDLSADSLTPDQVEGPAGIDIDEVPDIDTGPKPPAPTNFNGYVEDTSIMLSWKNPIAEGFQQVRLTRNATATPAGPDDVEEVLYTGTEETFTYAGPIQIGETYHFSVYAYYGEVGYSEGQNQSVTSCYSKLDIVFVMDVSTTMEYILQTLHDDMANVWNAAVEVDITPQFGLVVFVDDVTAVNDGAPFDSLEGVQGGFADWIEFIQTYGNKNTLPTTTGYNTDMPENTLDALATAVEKFPWREIDKTLRVIIHTTDDTFLEKPAVFKSNVAVQHTYEETLDILTGEQVRVGTFAAKTAWRPTIEEPDNEKDITPGYFVDYNGNSSIPKVTGGAAYDLDLVGQPAPDGISMDAAINDFIKDRLCLPY